VDLNVLPYGQHQGSEGLFMATHVLTNVRVARLNSPISAEVIRRPEKQSLRRSRGFCEKEDDLFVSTKAGLQGAKGALIALGIELSLVVCSFGVWEAWRLLR